MHDHNQAKSWEYFRDFVAVMGIYFLMLHSHSVSWIRIQLS